MGARAPRRRLLRVVVETAAYLGSQLRDHTVSRIDIKTNAVVATIPVDPGPAASEGGIAATPEGIWLVTDATGILGRIDPATNKLEGKVTIRKFRRSHRRRRLYLSHYP
jgi:DNA-binding beta-propeller fold protein YncE